MAITEWRCFRTAVLLRPENALCATFEQLLLILTAALSTEWNVSMSP